MGLPDVFDILVLLGAGLMAFGGEQIHPGAGFALGGCALYLIGLRGPSVVHPPSAPLRAVPRGN